MWNVQWNALNTLLRQTRTEKKEAVYDPFTISLINLLLDVVLAETSELYMEGFWENSFSSKLVSQLLLRISCTKIAPLEAHEKDRRNARKTLRICSLQMEPGFEKMTVMCLWLAVILLRLEEMVSDDSNLHSWRLVSYGQSETCNLVSLCLFGAVECMSWWKRAKVCRGQERIQLRP